MLKKLWEKLWPPVYLFQLDDRLSDDQYNRFKLQVEEVGLKNKCLLVEGMKVRKI